MTNWSQYVETFGALEEGGRRNPHLPGALPLARRLWLLPQWRRALLCHARRPAERQRQGRQGQRRPCPAAEPLLEGGAVADRLGQGRRRTQDIEVEIAPPTGDAPPEGTLHAQDQHGQRTEETYENVNLGQKRHRTSLETVNQTSQLVTVAEAQAAGPIAERIARSRQLPAQGRRRPRFAPSCSRSRLHRAMSPSAAVWKGWRSPKT